MRRTVKKKKFSEWARGCFKPWQCKYRLVKYTYYRYSVKRMEDVYKIQGRVKFTPFWFLLAEHDYFGPAYKQMKELRGVPKARSHVYTEDECVLELLGDAEDDT